MLRVAIYERNQENIEMAKKMLKLLETQQFSTGEHDCQAFYLEKGFDVFPSRSPEEREASKSRRYA